MYGASVSLIVLCYFIFYIEAQCHINESPIVTTPLGEIRGTSNLKSRSGKTIYAFRNIRYAKPPINELRFQPPVPIGRWTGIYDATQDGVFCPQLQINGNSSEDCLMLNVYTTKLPSSESLSKRPVIVHVHAGGFYSSGSPSTWAGPDYYLDQDIVLVTFNYRLATLGFLSTGDKHAPGNNGFKDQVELLKWVKNNIAAFGGDPDSVTLDGYSAGGWSNVLHMVSPMSQGLFHKVISMSGTPLGVWQIPREQLDLAKRQARLIGCPDDSSENIVKCLKTVPAEKLGQSLPGLSEFGWDPVIKWSPVIEDNFGQTRFLTDDPVNLIKQGKFQNVPFMTGQTKDELLEIAFDVVRNATLTQEMHNDFERTAPISFLYERYTSRSKEISRAIRNFYFQDKPIDESQLDNLSKVYTDALIGFSANRAAKLFAQYSTKPVYYYCFTFGGRCSHFYLPGANNTVPVGTVHHDDLIYLFYNQILFPRFGRDWPHPEIDMVEKLTTMHANFARTGNPIPQENRELDNVHWDRFTMETQKYLDIGNELVLKQRLFEDRFHFWDKFYPL